MEQKINSYRVNHLDQLESEAIYVIREAAAQFEKVALLFSGGKDSIVMAHLSRKAFFPAKLPFSLLHVDTGHNFKETLDFRDKYVAELGANLIVVYVQDSINRGTAKEESGINASRNSLQSITLLEAIEDNNFDACLGGGRRDEEKARAKERFFSHRDDFGQWDPKNQRPELWNLFNGKKHHGENFRVFPLSNWTEMDVWQYIKRESIPLPNLYFSHNRDVVHRNGSLLSISDHVVAQDGEEIEKDACVRFRTIGDMTCTGAFYSEAHDVESIIKEVSIARNTERGTRSDDKRSETAMEDRKKEGYF